MNEHPKWKVGSSWKMRNDEKATVLLHDNRLRQPVVVIRDADRSLHTCTEDGCYFENVISHRWDIIGPWEEPKPELVVEVGGVYETRRGWKAYVYIILPPRVNAKYPVRGYLTDSNGYSDGEFWTRDGRSREGIESQDDLVRRIDEVLS